MMTRTSASSWCSSCVTVGTTSYPSGTGLRVPGSRRTPAGSSERWTVRRLLAVVLTISAVVMLLVGFIGAAAVHESTQTVESLSEELAPAQVANVEFMVVMLDAENE